MFDFLLKPFNLQLSDILEVKTQNTLKGTLPDFTIVTKKSTNIRYEVKINDSGLTASECDENTRDAYLIRKNYYFREKIPLSEDKILYWEDLFEAIDQKGATKNFARLDLVREYINEGIHTLLLTRHEVAMLYSRNTIIAVYEMKEKLLKLCKNFLDTNESIFQEDTYQDNKEGIGYYFNEIKDKKRLFL